MSETDTYLRGYKIELDLNNKHITQCNMNAGTARWAYNFALAIKKDQFDNKLKISSCDEISKQLTILRKLPEYNWLYKASSHTIKESLRCCDVAFNNFFRNCKDKSKKKKGFPKFKSKKGSKKSFTIYGIIKSLENGRIQVPTFGILKLKEKDYLPVGCVIKSITISSRANRWFISALVEETNPEYIKPKNDIVGIDLGIKNLAVTSDEEYFENPKALRKNLKKLKFLQKRLSRKQKGSKNRHKQSLKLGKLHYRISNIRLDTLHKLTTKIINENQVIVLEDLKVSNMMKNHNLAQAISDVGWSMFRRMIEYKSCWRGRQFEYIDTFFPSSKTCCKCGWINHELKLSDRTFECKECGIKLERDFNSSNNLVNEYLRITNTVGLTGIHACGDERSQNIMPQNYIQCSSVKQESNVMKELFHVSV